MSVLTVFPNNPAIPQPTANRSTNARLSETKNHLQINPPIHPVTHDSTHQIQVSGDERTWLTFCRVSAAIQDGKRQA